MKLLGQEQAEKLLERHYTVTELAEQWNLSRDTIQRMFEDEPGVVVRTGRPFAHSSRLEGC